MVTKRVVCRLLMVVSLSLYAVSVLLPSVIEHVGTTFDMGHLVFRYWSFQMVAEALGLFHGIMANIVFLEYWFFPPSFTQIYAPLYLDIFRDWFFVFVLQIIAVVTGVASIVKEKVKGKPLLLICSTACLILTLILCYVQLARQLESRRRIVMSYTISSVSFDIGFYLALSSAILWIISLSFDRLVKRKQKREGRAK